LLHVTATKCYHLPKEKILNTKVTGWATLLTEHASYVSESVHPLRVQELNRVTSVKINVRRPT
jgi:hypothetical protein